MRAAAPDGPQTLRHDMRTRGVERSDWGLPAARWSARWSAVLRGALAHGFWDRMERQRMRIRCPAPAARTLGQAIAGPGGRRRGRGRWCGTVGWRLWDEDKSAYWGKGKPQGGGGKGGGWNSGGGDAGGGFSTGGSSDSGGGFRTGGSV